MEYLLLTMKTMKSLSSTPNITTRKSFNQELSNVSIPSTTLPSSPTGRCIPVHGCGPLQCKFQVFIISVILSFSE